ncbi:hypothetical protein PT306_00785 [Metamycoplasma hyosynoviae]|uniref:hypothetical protein n=1 Tax=Metamycoplasma hyosynoviae TaxID=29559 RepID=UPI00235EF576|nr:hypothetical protein [Metamycoplasma hyosynoviae]MDD1378808.1 hypothetical protein [Metamycoplasma hyosynoviae]
MKLPTYKDLGINIKKILWTNNFNSFEEFKNAYKDLFCIKLGHYLTLNHKHTKENFLAAYNVIFYYGYINYKRENNLLFFLEEKGFTVKPTYLVLDAVIGVDLIATKNNVNYAIQVKPNNKFSNLKQIVKYAKSRGFKVILAYKIASKWVFIDQNEQIVDIE